MRIEHYWTVDCLECEERIPFDDADERDTWLDDHRRREGHRVVSGIMRQTVDTPSGVIHDQAVANVVNILGVNRVISDEKIERRRWIARCRRCRKDEYFATPRIRDEWMNIHERDYEHEAEPGYAFNDEDLVK